MLYQSADKRTRANVLTKAMVLIGIGVTIGAIYAVLSPVLLRTKTDKKLDTTKSVQPATDSNTDAPDQPAETVDAAPSQDTTPEQPADPTADWPEHHVTVADAHQAWSNQAAVLVDTRPTELFEQEHVQGAISLPYDQFHAGSPPNLDYLMMDPSQQIILYCTGGDCHESDATATLLAQYGFTSVYVMHDGLPGWKDAGHPTATGPSSPWD